MGFRTRSATPGTLLCLVATILLAVVSFNTPLLKSLYFLEARFSSGQYAGTLRLGTLGYCLNVQGSESCVGPTVGYNFSRSNFRRFRLFCEAVHEAEYGVWSEMMFGFRPRISGMEPAEGPV